jgi:hypothetical protein
MAITDAQIRRFEEAMKKPGPEWDPDWAITRQLLQLVATEAKELLSLQAQLDAMTYAHTASTANLVGTIQRSLGAGVTRSRYSAADTQTAIANLEAAIKAAASGQQVASYAGNVLKFAAKLIL